MAFWASSRDREGDAGAAEVAEAVIADSCWELYRTDSCTVVPDFIDRVAFREGDFVEKPALWWIGRADTSTARWVRSGDLSDRGRAWRRVVSMTYRVIGGSGDATADSDAEPGKRNWELVVKRRRRQVDGGKVAQRVVAWCREVDV